MLYDVHNGQVTVLKETELRKKHHSEDTVVSPE